MNPVKNHLLKIKLPQLGLKGLTKAEDSLAYKDWGLVFFDVREIVDRQIFRVKRHLFKSYKIFNMRQ